MSPPIPPLREGLRVASVPDNDDFPAVLIDADLEQRLKLDPTVLAITRALADGSPSIAALAEATGAEPDLVERAVGLLRRMHLLDTDDTRAFVADASAVRAQQSADPAAVPLLIRDDAAFTCTMCGSCCGGHNVGPVSDAVLDGLTPHLDMLMKESGTAKGLFFQVPVPTADGELDYQAVCHTSGGSCVFLQDDNKCLIHARIGGDDKPAVCRLFPYVFTATPDGIAVSLQMECRGFAEAGQGRPLKAQEGDLRRLLSIAKVPRVRPIIALDRRQTLSWPQYAALEDELHAAIDAHRADPMAGLTAMRAVLERARGNDPDAAQERADRDTLVADLDALTDELCQTNGALRDAFHQDDERSIVHTDSLDLITLGLQTLRPAFATILRPPRRADQRTLLADSAHHHLHGKNLTNARRLTLGLARFAFGRLLAQSLAVARARQVKRAHLVGQDLVDATTIVNFMLRNSDFVRSLQRFDEGIESLFYDRLPALLATALADPDRRLELTKF